MTYGPTQTDNARRKGAMTDNAARNPESAAARAAVDAPPTAGPDPAATAAAGPDEALAKDNAELKDRLLRTLADMENLRRRTEREVADARAYGVANFARDMLAVADNLRRALDAIGQDARAALAPAMAAFVEGVELTERELLKTLEKHGVKKLDPLGAKFDPNLHQAMFEVPDLAAPAGTVVQVMQAGFTIGERVLRPAMVGVAKGGPKAQAPTAAASGAGSAGSEDAEQGAI